MIEEQTEQIWLPLDDPEGSARWIEQQDSRTLWQELLETGLFIEQGLNGLLQRDMDQQDQADLTADVEHARRLRRQLMEALKDRGELKEWELR